jgi:hypothetical protein
MNESRRDAGVARGINRSGEAEVRAPSRHAKAVNL